MQTLEIPNFPDFDGYQRAARRTANYPRDIDLLYVAMGIAGESGEFCNQVKKVYRDNHGVITDERRQHLLFELGDGLWYTSEAASVLGVSLAYIANLNLAKLYSREKNGTIHGDGDNR